MATNDRGAKLTLRMDFFSEGEGASCRLGANRIQAPRDLPFILPLLLLAGLAACKDAQESGSARQAQAIYRSSERVVALSPLATRFVVELGAGDQLVGIDAKSAALPGLGTLPIIDFGSARSVAPDLVLVSNLADLPARAVADLESTGARLVEFAPHDLEDVGALSRGLGAKLVGVASAAMFERRFSRPLALVADLSSPFDRLRVVAVVHLDPLTLAGGHSFETDLIEIGGGSSVTHGGDDSRIVMTQTRWAEFEPDLVIMMTRDEAGPLERHSARAQIPDRFELEFFDYDPETFWLNEPEEDAERMRALIARSRP